MKKVWGKLRMSVVLSVSKVLGVPVKVREAYLEEHVFGMEPRKTKTSNA